MAIILSLESSSEVCSVCIHRDLEVLALVETDEPFSHTRRMTLMIQEGLEEASLSMKDLDGVAVSHGPGSYTGLRVAAATAKGICYALGIPLVAVDTLEALAMEAQSFIEGELFIPMIDARRMEVYTAIYNKAGECVKPTYNLILEEGIFSSWEETGSKIVLCGTGVEKSKHFFGDERYLLRPRRLSATYMIPLAISRFQEGKVEEIVSYEPNYFKSPRVTASKKRPF